ncbi:MAG: hypothetical protein RLZZ308_742 [Candidatus Parcubacteria bacterium]|jgi:hypothetical protein
MFGFIFGMLFAFTLTILTYTAYIVIISFTLWMAVDAAKQDRFWWVALVVGVPLVGPALYFFTEKKHEYKKAPSHHVHTSQTEEQHEQSPKE